MGPITTGVIIGHANGYLLRTAELIHYLPYWTVSQLHRMPQAPLVMSENVDFHFQPYKILIVSHEWQHEWDGDSEP